MNTPAGTTLDDLYEFLVAAGTAATLSRRTIDAYRVAVRSVQYVLGFDLAVDLIDLDVEDLVTQYHAETADRFTDHTRNTYEGSFRRAVRTFLDWVEHDRDWQVVRSRRYPATPVPTHETYRFPLRADEMITLRLPRDLTHAEAARIAAFVTALASRDSAPDAMNAPRDT